MQHIFIRKDLNKAVFMLISPPLPLEDPAVQVLRVDNFFEELLYSSVVWIVLIAKFVSQASYLNKLRPHSI